MVNAELEKYRIIDAYLKNKLSGKDLLEFEDKLKYDADLRTELIDQRLTNDIIIENRFYKVAESFEMVAKGGISNSWKIFSGVGGGIGAVAIGIYLFMGSNNPTPINSTPPVVEQKIFKGDTDNNNTDNNKIIDGDKVQTEPAPAVVQKVEPKATKKEVIKDKPELNPSSVKEERNVAKGYEDKSSFLEIPLDGEDGSSILINPELNQAWSIPMKGKKDAELKILDNTGKEIYKVDVKNGQPAKWGGLNNSGSMVEAGGYVYMLNFGGGVVEHGYIIIERSEEHKHLENFIK